MKYRSMPQMLWIGVLGIFIFGSYLAANVLEVFYGNADIWWTPKTMMRNLDETKNDFQMFISGRPLAGLIEKGALSALDDQGNSYQVAAKDVGVRLNNWPSRQTSLLKFALVHAFLTGVSLSLTGVGIGQVFRRRNEAP